MRHRTSASDLNAAQRQAQALSMRRAGHTLQEISDACGYKSRSSAHKAIRAALRDLPKYEAQELLQLEHDRLDLVLVPFLQKACKGNVAAAHIVIQAVRARAQLFGTTEQQIGAGTVVIIESTEACPRCGGSYYEVNTGQVIAELPPGQVVKRVYGTDISNV